ncbi:hypothetical protein CPLU01_16056, partial [Colletotrichum plurivorum]
MFDVDGRPRLSEADGLQYLSNAVHHMGSASGEMDVLGIAANNHSNSEPVIRATRGGAFSDSFDPAFFPMAFPTLFPYGSGGPRLAEENLRTGVLAGQNEAPRDLVSSRNLALDRWARLVLQRHGARFSAHPVFSFLVFNMGVRSRNNRVSMIRVQQPDFAHSQRLLSALEPGRLEAAVKQLQETRRTTDEAVNELLRQLSHFGHRQPFSKENRLTMRRKIQSFILKHGLPSIWITINPDDIVNPVKLKLAAFNKHERPAAEAFLADLNRGYKKLALAIADPVSAAIFFHREVSMFFEHYVRVGKESVFGRISEYFGAVETNERGALHLHGLLWLEGNISMPSFLEDAKAEDAGTWRSRVAEYADSVFSEVLDVTAYHDLKEERSSDFDPATIILDKTKLREDFSQEANFVAATKQIHTHTPTCVKYSFKHRKSTRSVCRFGAPWDDVEATGFTKDGTFQIRRNHPSVNRYNEAMALGLRHNHDISFILTKCKSLAIIYYLTNYTTKEEDPVWKRVATAKEYLDTLRASLTDEAPEHGRGNNQEVCRARTFLTRVANRFFTDRPLSHVEVVAYLMGYPMEVCGTSAWTFLNVSALYWVVSKQWPYLQRLLGNDVINNGEGDGVLLEAQGQKITLLQAYPHRGQELQNVALYDYMSMVTLRRRKDRSTVGHRQVELDASWPLSEAWVQVVRTPDRLATVCIDGYLTTNMAEEDERTYRRFSVQHLALFVPWQNFTAITTGDINDIWT